jgi:hypothetical protein
VLYIHGCSTAPRATTVYAHDANGYIRYIGHCNVFTICYLFYKWSQQLRGIVYAVASPALSTDVGDLLALAEQFQVRIHHYHYLGITQDLTDVSTDIIWIKADEMQL